jgi:GNAT superfamily N-acetyltransferase
MVTVRPAVSGDADAIGRVQAETWRATYAGIFPEEAFDVVARQSTWRGYLAGLRLGTAVFVAEDTSDVVGFASLGACRDEDGIGELFAIYVHPRRWNTGAGRALIERGEEYLRGVGFPEAILWVLEGNERAESFYRAGGWEHDGGRKVEEFQGAQLTEIRYRKVL